ncbi:MAG: adenylate/guanylate cyclase domain-containing protein, partial [SAR324 cluster bacterium]|nr:adenylate/guanylate cyclase domain-containing protein [SAR324 cluster bacterium]
MASSDVQRKLTAILCADVVGYSRLMGENEKATLRTLTEYRQVFAGYIEKFRGRIVNAPGDSILAEFVSVVDAVEGAAEIQRELAERNAEIVDDRKMLFRIGINLGDVLVKDGDIYGDGVNIAARLESLAEPGGICIARAVYDQVKQKLKIHVEYMGEQQVKNIAEPVRAYQVLTKPGDAAHRVVKAKRIVGRAWRNAALAVAAVVVLVGGGLLGWNYYQQSLSAAALAAFEKEAAFPLPDRPSIAVLAFDNM